MRLRCDGFGRRSHQKGKDCAEHSHRREALDGLGQSVGIRNPSQEGSGDAAHAGCQPQRDAGGESDVSRQIFLTQHHHGTEGRVERKT